MKCALHIHTNLSDGLNSPEEILHAYLDRGFQCVAITDHQFMTKPNYFNYLERLAREFNGKMLVLPGVELDFEPWNYQHLLEIRGREETLRIFCHPRQYLLTPEQIRKQIEESPVRIDALEVTHRGFYTPEYDLAQIPLPKVATDDAHEIYDIGRGWIETDYHSQPDQLIRAIRAGQFKFQIA